MSAATSHASHQVPPTTTVRVAARRDVADGVVAFELEALDGTALSAWTPGAHLDVLIAAGLERQYSLCGPLDSPRWTIAVLREVDGRGGSAWMHDSLTVGASLDVRGPWNHFELAPATAYRFVAGGIGITPLLPMLAAATAQGIPWTLDYAGRSRSTMAFVDALELLGAAGAGTGAHAGADSPASAPVRIWAADEGKRLDLAALQPKPGEAVYACGPRRLLDALDEASAAWEPGCLHVERFEARITEAVRHESFEVDFQLSGVTATVEPGQSIIDVAEANGVFVLSSCREGTCGTCETVVLEGEVDHRDAILSASERAANDRMMVCVSRAACPRLVLEL